MNSRPGFNATDLPLRPAEDLVVPMESLSQAPEEDWDIIQDFPSCKQQYLELAAYVEQGRQEKINECNTLVNRIYSVEMSLQFVPPESAMALMAIIQEHRARVTELEGEIHTKDGLLEPYKNEINSKLLRWSSTDPTRLQDFIYQFQWPDLQACQDLELPYQFTRYWLQGMQHTPAEGTTQEKGGENPMVADLLRRIQDLEKERSSWKKTEGNKVAGNKAHTETAIASGEITNRSDKTIMERRKRARIPTFDQGNVDEAQKWINAYESMCKNFLKFTDQELVDELYAVMHGRAGSWFNSLSTEIKKEWRLVKERFLHQFGGGAKPALSALNKLKTLKQKNMPISEFVNVFQDLIFRAQIFAPDIQLDYFKEGIRPELCDAIMFGRAKDLDSAVEIVTEAEREWKRKGRYHLNSEGNITANWTGGQGAEQLKVYSGSTSGSNSSSGTGEPQQNQQQQETRTCFFCQKVGHLKVDCRKRKMEKNQGKQQYNGRRDFRNNKRSYNNQQDIQEIETEETEGEDDEDLNVFAHFLNNNQQIICSQMETNPQRHRVRFGITTKGTCMQALADTGSTICSIDKGTADRLGLEYYSCNNTTISYGNKSTQTTNQKTTLRFKINGMEDTKANLYVVDQQNEPVILGADWMCDEDIMVRPKTNEVRKWKVEMNNSMELVEDMIREKFPKLIEESTTQSLTTANYEHVIDTGDARPIASRDYRRSELENRQIQEEVEKMLEMKVIEPSNSDWCSPVVLIDKPDGSKRFCVDYRKLNQVTIKDKYPLPRITELLDKLHGCKYLSTIDLKSGYWQLPLEKNSAKKTAFVANGSLYQFNSLPFGVVNGPSSFMRLMHHILKNMKNTLVYLDDVICFSKTKEEHMEALNNLLSRLCQYNLKISFKKCQFFQQEVKFLGFLVGRNGIKSDPSKVEVVKNWPIPRNVKALQKFLGFCAFYHRFIENLSDIAKPLNSILQTSRQGFQKPPAKNDGITNVGLPKPGFSLRFTYRCK
jgi:hypothetical protein